MPFEYPVEGTVLQPESYDLIEEGPASTVSRTWSALEGEQPQWVVVKTATTRRKFSKEPHDIIKELRILSSLSHSNIVSVLGHTHDGSTMSIWMPYIPISLSNLLVSPSFSPHPSPYHHDTAPESQGALFDVVVKSIMVQTLAALAYLHDDGRKISHRDIKPNNILLTPDGCVKLIDFGIVWRESETEEAKREDLWPEYSSKLYFEVSTGPYRAPELLFGTRHYDALAIDSWSLGATFAEFFTPLRLCPNNEYDQSDDLSDSSGDEEPTPFIIPMSLRLEDPDAKWHRETLFNADRGEIGLAWSIFRIRGTPTEEIWPTFDELPDAKGVIFNSAPPVPLAPLLPNLPIPSTAAQVNVGTGHFPNSVMSPTALDLLSRFLVYPSSQRLSPLEGLDHPWFKNGSPLLLPQEYVLEYNQLRGHVISEWEGKSLGECLESISSATQ